MNENLTSAQIENLSFDSFGRNPDVDVVCLAPIRTIVRREEEITFVRKVRKVEELESPVACPSNLATASSQLDLTTPEPTDPDPSLPTPAGLYASDWLEVYAKEDRQEFLARFENTWGRTIQVRFETSDTWNYGGTEGYAHPVDGDGQQDGTIRDPRFPNAHPASLVSFRNGLDNPEFVASGKDQTVELQPGETLFFINNDQAGYYGDNDGKLNVRWTIVG